MVDVEVKNEEEHDLINDFDRKVGEGLSYKKSRTFGRKKVSTHYLRPTLFANNYY